MTNISAARLKQFAPMNPNPAYPLREYNSHLACELVRLLQYPNECPAKYMEAYKDGNVMACPAHRIWWVMLPPSETLRYWEPPYATNEPDPAPTTQDQDPDVWLPGLNAPTTLITKESKELLANYYANLKMALQQGTPTGDLDTRLEFLNDVLTTAVENNGYGPWMVVEEYNHGNPTTPGYAVITVAKDYRDPDSPDDMAPYRIDHATLEKGFRMMRHRAGIHNHPTQELNGWVADILQADILNDAGIMDVTDALNIVEVALFGEVRYS